MLAETLICFHSSKYPDFSQKLMHSSLLSAELHLRYGDSDILYPLSKLKHHLVVLRSYFSKCNWLSGFWNVTFSRSSQEMTLHWDLTVAQYDSFITMTWNQIYSQKLQGASCLLAVASFVASGGLHKEALAALWGSICFSYLVLWGSYCWGSYLPCVYNWNHAANMWEYPSGSVGARYLQKRGKHIFSMSSSSLHSAQAQDSASNLKGVWGSCTELHFALPTGWRRVVSQA